MKQIIEVLQVKFHEQNVGRLALGYDGICRFEYDTYWLKNGFSISPFVLPLKSGLHVAKREPFNGLFGVFSDSMPDGWGNLLLDRFLLSQGVSLSALSPLDRLALVGTQGLGALTYEPDQSFTASQKSYNLERVAKQVADILSEEADLPTVNSLLQKTGSSGGARPKVLIQHKADTWLVKFASSSDSKDIGEQEFFYANLAKQCGIRMSETELFEGKYFGTKLFDRDGSKRLHMHSAAGLLHASHRYPSLDYLQLAQATIALTKDQRQLAALLRQMVFNVLIANKDDHSKNFSFLYRNQTWELSPAYDILRSEGFGGEHATSVNGAGMPKRSDFFELSNKLNFPKKEMTKIVDEVYDVCMGSVIASDIRKRKL